MMSVKEYAQDINKTIEEVLAKCKELNIDVNSTEDILEEDHVIDLDNAFNNMFTEEKEEGTEDIIDDEKIEEIISKVNIDVDDTVKKQKLKKRVDNKNNDFFVKRKEMYKNKEKLTANIPTAQENIILYKEGMTVNELANTLEVRAAELIKKLIDLGIMSNINSVISFDDAELLVVDYNKELKRAETQDEANFEKLEITDDEKDLECRPPVVTIMGHVDHGKTTLLDKIRETNVVGSEFGGITQHIGAYQITYHDQKITFIDTPGHEAFTEMRARGASITDIVLIIVAADDGVMPQTKEAIDHAKAAKVPIIVVINKIDKKEADPDKIMTQMTENGLTPEEWGGNTIFTKVSATTGVGIPELLENILLVTELEE
ncbi:MAG: translation initiation factor IF-2 N-terminal domain-containing protein, partial [Bacilli bacterium]|nr:translation initiation factor IF-2 N-terminal domain-containing protein [Bacilli bacterium]